MRFDALVKQGPSSREANLTGLVVRYDRFSAAFVRILLQVDGLYVWAIQRANLGAELDDELPSIGALIQVTGSWKVFQGIPEIEINTLDVIAQSPRWPGGNSPRSMELLGLRSLVVREMHALFREWDYVPVDSPTIVSEWVLGDTVPFEVQFYNRKEFLTISNMIYHQMLACNGFNRFYEIGRLFRREKPSSRRKLAEFTIVDISRVGVGISDIMSDFENLISATVATLTRHANFATPIKNVYFDTIDWTELTERAGGSGGNGSQLNADCRHYLNEHYDSFVWVTGFPVDKRPFYTKATDGISHDCQLWYRGQLYLVAGSEVETDSEILRQGIREKGSDPRRYRQFLDVVDAGMPLVSMAGMGLERLLALVLNETVAADFTMMPRHQNTFVF
ncbi:MAG TPA: amino acid--tRNA ligase-related protein [Enteractinococcus sp.]